jgi:hypothetical protein
MGKVYRTMQGTELDLEKFISKNETTPAIGNLRVNARGDELGPGGKIIRKRESIVAEYYEDNPKAKPRIKSLDPAEKLDMKSSVFEETAEKSNTNLKNEKDKK